MKRAALYIRVSTQEQAQEGYSVGEQKECLIAYCKAQDWIISNIYVDPGYSGANLKRPGIQKLMAETSNLDTVLVYKLDRLLRSQRDTLYLIEEIFLPNKVDFVSIQESFDTLQFLRSLSVNKLKSAQRWARWQEPKPVFITAVATFLPAMNTRTASSSSILMRRSK